MNSFYKIFFSVFLFIQGLFLHGQFYTGMQMDFGKNRVQYNDFYWSFLRYEKFDVYFNQYGINLAEYTAAYAQKEIDRIESFYDYTLSKRIIFIVYNKLTDFRQSNIDLVSGNEEYNTGGVTQISRNKVFIYFEGDHREFENQISGMLSKVYMNEMLYGGELTENVTSNTLMDLPGWYVEGLQSFVAENWSVDIESKVKDGILNRKYEKINRLSDEDARIAGHSFWRYIAVNYGEGVIPNIIYLTKINKNVKIAFISVLGLSLKELAFDWIGYYINYFDENYPQDNFPESKPIIKKPKRKHIYSEVKLNPNGKLLAYVTNHDGKYKIWLYNFETGKRKRILKKGHSLEQIVDYSFPVLTWHPSGRILTFVTEEEGGLKLYFYTVYNQELTVRNLLYFDKILDASYSHDGSQLAFSAVKNGKTDIFVHTLASSTNEQITNDLADDFSPRFINGSKELLFSSNRLTDSLVVESPLKRISPTTDLFIFNIQTGSDKLFRLDNSNFFEDEAPLEVAKHQFLALNDYNGIINRYTYEYDSVISFIDTTIHYRYYTVSHPLTNYSTNILDQSYSANNNVVVEKILHDGRQYLYTKPLDLTDKIPSKDIKRTRFKDNQIEAYKEESEAREVEKVVVPVHTIIDNKIITEENDTIELQQFPIDINNYVFELEKINLYNERFKDKNIVLTMDTVEEKRPKIRIYQASFYPNQLVSQVDFSFINASYQVFTGGPVFFNPGLNVFTKIGVQDLFEDYKITGGFRLTADFNSYEFLGSIENLKNRWDKQFIFHRQTNKDNFVKIITNNYIGKYKYPFSQVLSAHFTGSIRQDRIIRLADPFDHQSLDLASINDVWASAKVEYIFDNTRMLGINILSGSRYKIFGEAFKKLTGEGEDLYVWGADFRHYEVIHRNLIFASRFAASSSVGRSKLLYYLGGVDNWTQILGFPRNFPIFNPLSEIPINAENYAFQTVATNMRGFSQNIRNGNNFALVNAEIRWPIIRYFANYPISSSFLNNLQTVGFFDVGTAWTGLTPWSDKNAYENKVYDLQSIRITIDANRPPIVAGYGFGLRTQLLGYFIRLDWAWGIENYTILPRVFYFSTSLDF